MEKLRMQSKDSIEEKIAIIGSLFPNCITEQIVDGKIIQAIDYDSLRVELTGCMPEDYRQERYQLTWPDKTKAKILSNSPTRKTLRPCPDESVNFDNTKNIYIEGDNLDVLKIIRETYLNKIKMIYIDPPYNRDDQLYPDNYKQSVQEYIKNSGQIDENNNKLVKNSETNGRYHTDWLNMMYPRIRVAKDLLTDDGVIFISIADEEVANLKKICEEIFGYDNFVAQLVWQNKKGGGNDSNQVAIEHEYILIFARNKKLLHEFYEKYSSEYAKRYNLSDDVGRYYWDTFKRKSAKQYYPITCPDGTVLEYDEDGNRISWLRCKERFENDLKIGDVKIENTNGHWSVKFKQRMPKGKTPRSLFTTEPVISDRGTTSEGASDLYKYFKKDVFSNPKPLSLIEFIIGFGLNDGDLILDFFSGSATTAEAVMQLNKEGADYQYILVQFPEDIDPMLKSSSANTRRIAENAVEYLEEHKLKHTIPELAKERIRKAGISILKDEQQKKLIGGNVTDTGFRVFKLDSSNMKEVFYEPDKTFQYGLDSLIDNVKEDRNSLDLLFQVMLELGMELSSKITSQHVGNKEIFSVDDGYLIACFDEDLSEDVITYIAKNAKCHAVIRESGIENDSMYTNFEQIFKTYNPEIQPRVL